MATFIMLTRVDHGEVHAPLDLEDLEKHVMLRIHAECPQVKWLQSYAVLGPYEYLDIFSAPDVMTATKVATLIRTMGHGQAEIWPATEWGQFKDMLHRMHPSESLVTSAGEQLRASAQVKK